MAGETALARQLKKLAAPQTSLLVQGRIRKSFLFDHRHAASLDRDIFFDYGTTGLEKLKMMNPAFQKFEQNIFSANYKDFERAVQTASVNKTIDERITEFFRMSTPFFLTRGAHEALEWLVYRFHVHLYNVDALMQAALPHYNTSTFVRVVQLLNLEVPGCRWTWLLQVQKSGVHPEFSAIVNHFNSDDSFKKFVCDLAPNSLKVNKDTAAPVVSFSMLTVYSALGRPKSITDETINLLFPYILRGLRSGMPKYIAATYLVISRIMVSVKLTEELVNQLLVKVFEHVSVDLLKQACELLVVTFQQQSLESLSKDLYAALFLQKNCLKDLGNMSTSYEMTSFLSALIKMSVRKLFQSVSQMQGKRKKKVVNVDKHFEKVNKYCVNIINLFCLDEKTLGVFFNSVISGYSKMHQKSVVGDGGNLKAAKFLLKSLESKYPEYFDNAISAYFQKRKGDNKKHLCNLINQAVCSVKNKVLPDKQTTLVLGVNHSSTDIRTTSVKYLIEEASSGRISDSAFIEDSLSTRLLDDSPEVVAEVLSSPQTLLKYLEKKAILIRFGEILRRKVDRHSEWYPVQMACLDVVCNNFSKETKLGHELFVTLLPFIFPVHTETVHGFLKVVKSKVAHFLPVLQVLINEHQDLFELSKKDPDQLVKLNYAVVSSLRKYVSKLPDSEKSVFLSFMKEKSLATDYPSLLTLFVFASSEAIISHGRLESKCLWLENLLSFLGQFPHSEVAIDEFKPGMTDETAIHQCVRLLYKGHFPAVVIFNEFHKIVTLLELDVGFLTSNPWMFKFSDQNHKAFKVLYLIFEFCAQQIKQNGQINKKSVFTNNLTNLFTTFVKCQFKKPECLFGFLSLLWANVSENVPILLQVSALEIGLDSMEPLFSYDWCFENQIIFLSLLKAASSLEVEVRKEALNLLRSLMKSSSTLDCSAKALIEVICEQVEEITIDHHQCFVVVRDWLKPAFELYGSQNVPLLEHKYTVLDSFIKLLLNETIPNTMKNQLLLLLQEADSVEILSAIAPLISKTILYFADQKEMPANELYIENFGLLVKHFTAKTALCLKSTERGLKCPETDVFLKCLELVEQGLSKDGPLILHTLSILNKEFFRAIPSIEVQRKILDVLLNACLSSNAELNANLKKVLRKLSTYAYLILEDFQDKEMPSQKSATLREIKKSKTQDTESTNTFETKPWKKMTVLLEIIQNKPTLDNRQILIPELFNLLHKTLTHDTESSVEYIRQMILSTIHNCCEHLGSETLDERQFKVEYIVQCIRSSINPKTHYQSLLLLNLAATMFPDYVLNNVMSIFTFMGSSLVRQDDSYSFQVISKTIETIVPSLLRASQNQKEADTMQVVAAVIRVFVDSLPDIPRHRQLPLFTKLITTLDPARYLWIPFGQICDQYASIFSSSAHESSDRRYLPILDFAESLQKEFLPGVQIDTCINLLSFVSVLPDSKDRLKADTVQNVTEPFNVSSHSDEQLQTYKYNVLSYINMWLSSQAFISQVSELKQKVLNKLECKYEILLEKVLQYLQHQRSIQMDNENHSLFPLLIDLVGHINSLLPCHLFIRVVQRLLKNSEPVIQNKAIELLCCKLEYQHRLFDDEDSRTHLLKLLKPLLKIVQKHEENSLENVEESAASQQVALYAIHLLTKVIGSEYSAKFHKVLDVTIQILNDNTSEELTVNALLCLAQLCSSMNVHVLPRLNTFMPMIIQLLSDINIQQMNDCLMLGVTTALISIVTNLGAFLSGYMSQLVCSVCELLHQAEALNKRAVCEKLIDFQTILAEDIDLRILLTAIEESYLEFVKIESDAISPLVKMLEQKLTTCSYTDIEACSSKLQLFCINLLDYRNTLSTKSSASAESINTVEISIFSAVRTFVMKLSVTHFQSFFKQIYLWATATEPKLPHRHFTFYGLTCELSKSLRNLFVVVAKTFLKNAASELDSYNLSKNELTEESEHPFLSTHICNIIDTLKDCFVNADNQLMDKNSFETLLQPLVDQLENIGDNEEEYQKRIADHLGVCLAYFMASVNDNALWKKLNYQILLKTRHDSAVVRFAAIQVIRDVVVAMGDNYLALLPESIPFLAEMMEDESAEVEHQCQSVISEMEKILGEPIRKYF